MPIWEVDAGDNQSRSKTEISLFLFVAKHDQYEMSTECYSYRFTTYDRNMHNASI